MALGSSRPYLIRALFDWIVDGGEDPYVVVDATYPEVMVPESHIKDGQIILNLAPRAITGFSMGDAGIAFQARFGGVPNQLFLPYGAVSAIYGRESGLGMGFGHEPGGVPSMPGADQPEVVFRPPEVDETPVELPAEPSGLKPKGRPALRIVKSDD